MRQSRIVLLLCTLTYTVHAQTVLPKKTGVLLSGTFHSANPGPDMAKSEDAIILLDCSGKRKTGEMVNRVNRLTVI
jgi:hypothetical protein